MTEKLYVKAGKRMILAKQIVCGGCQKLLLVRNSNPHSGYCKKCWPKINKGGHGDVSGLNGRKVKPNFIKTCPICNENRPSYKKEEQPIICKKCYTKSVKKDREKIRKGLITRRAERKIKLVKLFGNKCSKCNEKNLPISVYEFHHFDKESKVDGISKMISKESFEKVLEECKKCVMVCANCHKIIHHGELRVE